MKVIKMLVNSFFRVGQFNNKNVKRFSKGIKNKKILELGSGKPGYSLKKYFDESNEFVQSDVVEEYGHKIVDVTTMDYKNEFDIILCTNVLEHVFDFQKGIEKLYEALKEGGTAIVFVPAFYPLHDEPNDFWRFTEHSLRKLLKRFKEVRIKTKGIRQYPFAYYVETVK